MNLPVSLIFITADRASVFKRTIESLFEQKCVPSQVIVIDASIDDSTLDMLHQINWGTIELHYEKAIIKGAAEQRNQGIKNAIYNYIGFFDDDILFEQDCLNALFIAINSDKTIGGVNAFITNQHSFPLGKLSKAFYWFMRDGLMNRYDGKCFGPAINTLTLDYKGSKNLIQVDWLNSTCTLYKNEALPNPVFDNHFKGYALMEDLALSLRVGKNWKLFNVQNAKIFHDSQPGMHKNSQREISKMALVNRHYVMREILGKTSIKDYLKLFLLEVFNFLSLFRTTQQTKKIPYFIIGKLQGIWAICKGK